MNANALERLDGGEAVVDLNMAQPIATGEESVGLCKSPRPLRLCAENQIRINAEPQRTQSGAEKNIQGREVEGKEEKKIDAKNPLFKGERATSEGNSDG